MNMYVVFFVNKQSNWHSFLKVIIADSFEQAKAQFDACKVELDDVAIFSDNENLDFVELIEGGFNTWHIPALEIEESKQENTDAENN